MRKTPGRREDSPRRRTWSAPTCQERSGGRLRVAFEFGDVDGTVAVLAARWGLVGGKAHLDGARSGREGSSDFGPGCISVWVLSSPAPPGP